jgi:hypothetical protein
MACMPRIRRYIRTRTFTLRFVATLCWGLKISGVSYSQFSPYTGWLYTRKTITCGLPISQMFSQSKMYFSEISAYWEDYFFNYTYRVLKLLLWNLLDHCKNHKNPQSGTILSYYLHNQGTPISLRQVLILFSKPILRRQIGPLPLSFQTRFVFRFYCTSEPFPPSTVKHDYTENNFKLGCDERFSL